MKTDYLVDAHDRFDAVPEAMAEIGDVDLLVIDGDIATGGTPDRGVALVAQPRRRRSMSRNLRLAMEF
jgi:hypothetical protein